MKKESFEYTPNTFKEDKKLFFELLKDFPPNGRGANFLQLKDLGSPIHDIDLEIIDNFLSHWSDVMHEFINPEIEEKRHKFISLLNDFQSELSKNIFPASGNLNSMYLDGLKVPRHRFEARDKLNNMATQVFDLYKDLLRCCKIVLGTVDDES